MNYVPDTLKPAPSVLTAIVAAVGPSFLEELPDQWVRWVGLLPVGFDPVVAVVRRRPLVEPVPQAKLMLSIESFSWKLP